VKDKLEHFFPRADVRQGYVCVEGNSKMPVFSAIDLVKMSKCCGAVSAKGIFWRLLREHHALSQNDAFPAGVYSVKFSPHGDEMIAVDAEMACELLMLIPGSAHAQDLRRKAVKSLLEIEEDREQVCGRGGRLHLLSSGPKEARQRLEGRRLGYSNLATLRKLLTAAAIFGVQWYPLRLGSDLSPEIIARS